MSIYNCCILSKHNNSDLTQWDEANNSGPALLQLPAEVIRKIGLWVEREPNGIVDGGRWSSVCVLTHLHWHETQAEADALKTMWTKMPSWCGFVEHIEHDGCDGSWGGGNLKTVRQIRWWFENYETDHQKAQIHELYLLNLGLRTLPREMARLPQLCYLDLSKNHLEAIPKVLGECSNLSRLILDDNNITNVPEWLPKQCPKLWWVQLLNNPVSHQPESNFSEKLREIIVLK